MSPLLAPKPRARLSRIFCCPISRRPAFPRASSAIRCAPWSELYRRWRPMKWRLLQVPCILSAKFTRTFWLARGVVGCFLRPALSRIAVGGLWAAMLLPATVFAQAPASNPGSHRGGGVPAPVRAEHEEPVNVTGNETIYDSGTDTFFVKGDAVMTQGGSVLKADEIDVMRRQREAHAFGHVHLIDPEIEMWATDARLNLNDETFDLYNAKILAKQNTYHLEGKRIIKLKGQNYEVKNGFFTTCACQKGAPDWSITADQMDVNLGTNGTAHNGK